ncbi:MAG: triose-phosphate isomerase [Chloroflexota bacterium]
MRKPLIAANWKMNTTLDEGIALVNAIKLSLEKTNSVESLICPPFVSLVPISGIIKGSPIKLGAQNLYFEEKGAFTGEISPLMLKGVCEYVILGHSERRQYFGDTGEVVNKKIKAALKAGLKPILCVGENLKENEAGKTDAVVAGQLRDALGGASEPDGLVIAYEPIWAIGTGKAATAKQAGTTIGFIRQTLTSIYNREIAGTTRILYGGSVNPDNTADLMREAEIDGALVGGASLRAEQFTAIVTKTAEVKATK